MVRNTLIAMVIGGIIGFSPLRNSGLAKFLVHISGG